MSELKRRRKRKPRKPQPIVSAIDMTARGATAKGIRRVVSHALASGMRNVLSVDVELHYPPMGRAYREVRITFIDLNLKAKW